MAKCSCGLCRLTIAVGDKGQRYAVLARTAAGVTKAVGYADHDPWQLAATALLHPSHVEVAIVDRRKLEAQTADRQG